MKKILVPAALIGVVLAVSSLALWLSADVPSPNTFILKKDGWHPRELTVEPGTAITFVNKTGKDFWPASNAHPQHDLYAEFDSGHPIASGESWTFTFDRAGRWGFHDHLRSFYTGYVYVGQEAKEYDCSEHIEGLSIGEKRACWDDMLFLELEKNGAASAFTLFAKLYNSDPDFTVVGCHLIAHKLGDAAYGEYIRAGKDMSKLQFPPETIYCGYGYYHGILEHMIRDNPNFTVADNFCKMLIRDHSDTIPRIRLNCYHAIGHGFVPEPTDVEVWGDVRKMTAPAITACHRIPEPDASQECLQGTFNVIGDWMWNNEFGLRFPPEDSLATCRLFEGDVSQACYYELSMRLLPAANNSLKQVYEKYVVQIPDDFLAGMVINSAAAGALGAHIAGNDFIPFLKECRSLPERVHADCLKGLAGGFVAHGAPGQEYVKAVAFCSSAELTEDEASLCFENIIRNFKNVYSPEKVGAVCESIPSEYRSFCAYDS